MRIIKVNGEFVIDDEPMRLEGEDAKRFLAEMERVRTPEEQAEHRRFLDECVEVYRRSKNQND